MTLALLLAMCAFMVWACLHTRERIHWHADEVWADEFLAALRTTDPLSPAAASAIADLVILDAELRGHHPGGAR